VAACRTSSGTGVALINMGQTPLMATAVVNALAGGASIDDAAAVAAQGTEPPEDLNADVEYHTHLAQVLVRRALAEVAG
jgi:aerobic carbon-monoxide dehydrogenase medium subunit